jgi:signal transduction histidine kinase
VDLTEVAREAAVEIANDPRSDGRTVAFADAGAREPLPVSADVAYLSRALGNLLGNAVVHNAEGTTVTMSTHREAGWARVDVTDDGRGMDEATLGRLFDRYYRGTASGGDSSGTGLGMAIARQLVEAHGGTIAVASVPDAGTTISVRLPLISA